MKIIPGALTACVLPRLVEAGSDGRPRDKISIQQASSGKNTLRAQPGFKIPPHGIKVNIGSKPGEKHVATHHLFLDEPTIDGYTFGGLGCCVNSDDRTYDHDEITDVTVEECAVGCTATSDEYFVGFNFDPNFNGGTYCSCLKDRWGYGMITTTNGECWPGDLCYSYNEADPPAPLCDDATEQTCYDEDWGEESCVAYTDGGCPCPEGEVRCDADEHWMGYCTTECSTWS